MCDAPLLTIYTSSEKKVSHREIASTFSLLLLLLFVVVVVVVVVVFRKRAKEARERAQKVFTANFLKKNHN